MFIVTPLWWPIINNSAQTSVLLIRHHQRGCAKIPLEDFSQMLKSAILHTRAAWCSSGVVRWFGWGVGGWGYVPSQHGADGPYLPLFSSKSSRTVGQRAADVLDVRSVSAERGQPVIGPCCFSQGNVSGGAGPEAAGSPICSSNAADRQIRCLPPRSRGAIGEASLHMQMRWKWHKHVDTRIGFISAAGRKVTPGLVLVLLEAFLLVISSGWWCLTCGMWVRRAAPVKAQSAIWGSCERVC